MMKEPHQVPDPHALRVAVAAHATGNIVAFLEVGSLHHRYERRAA
jgi:hypothetical protein